MHTQSEKPIKKTAVRLLLQRFLKIDKQSMIKGLHHVSHDDKHTHSKDQNGGEK
jgi:hypothetical protein